MLHYGTIKEIDNVSRNLYSLLTIIFHNRKMIWINQLSLWPVVVIQRALKNAKSAVGKLVHVMSYRHTVSLNGWTAKHYKAHAHYLPFDLACQHDIIINWDLSLNISDIASNIIALSTSNCHWLWLFVFFFSNQYRSYIPINFIC